MGRRHEKLYSQFVDVLKEAEAQIGNIEIPDEVTDEICEKCGEHGNKDGEKW